MRAALVALALLLAGAGLAEASRDACVPRVVDDQDLACVDPLDRENAWCVYTMVNPPLPGTYRHSTTCADSECEYGTACRNALCALLESCSPFPAAD